MRNWLLVALRCSFFSPKKKTARDLSRAVSESYAVFKLAQTPPHTRRRVVVIGVNRAETHAKSMRESGVFGQPIPSQIKNATDLHGFSQISEICVYLWRSWLISCGRLRS